MSVSVHCMRLAASYDVLTEDKLRYRLAQSHTNSRLALFIRLSATSRPSSRCPLKHNPFMRRLVCADKKVKLFLLSGLSLFYHQHST